MADLSARERLSTKPVARSRFTASATFDDDWGNRPPRSRTTRRRHANDDANGRALPNPGSARPSPLQRGALSALPSAARNWPQRPVRLILPLGPGSGVDIGARLIADKLSAKWGQPVVVENRPGGDGFVAISAFVGANDDHVLLMSPTSSFTAHPYLHDKLPYDPRDLAPIARISDTVVGGRGARPPPTSRR